MIKVGLTGNIGSGKTIIARVFQKLGVPVYYADAEAKKFLYEQKVIRQIISWWGDDVIDNNNEVDRKKLAKIVFSNPENLALLNELIHPMLRNDLNRWFLRHSNDHYVIQEAAILFESGFDKAFDKIITVVCPEDIALKRIKCRDGITEAEFNLRKKNQWDQEIKMLKADYVVVNDDKALLIPQILNIHEYLREINPNNKGQLLI